MKSLSSLVLVGLTVAIGASASACAAPEAVKERRSSTTSSLGKPKPAIKTAASKETTEKYGITEWRMFRGKQDLFMTGYDADGKAVKGVTMSFKENEDDGEAQLVTKINDGSKVTASRNLATEALSADEIPADSADFVKQVAGDLGGISQIFSAGGGGADISEDAASCGADIATVCQLALQCCAGLVWNKGGGSVDSCWAAAKAAVSSAAHCASAVKGYASSIDLSKISLPTGHAKIDIGAILGGHSYNPMAGGGQCLTNPFGADSALVGNKDTGDVDFDSTDATEDTE